MPSPNDASKPPEEPKLPCPDAEHQAGWESDLAQAHPGDELSQLAESIAHDVDNLLTVINGVSRMLLKRVKPPHELHADLQLIARAGEGAAALTRQLLLLSGNQAHGKESGTAKQAGYPLPTSSATVLVVEDTVSVRAMLERVLVQQGYLVLTPASGAEALALTESCQPALLLVGDRSMPDMSGRQLVEQLTSRWPDMPVLLMSSSASPAPDVPGEARRFALLPKPFTLQELVQHVRELLSLAK